MNLMSSTQILPVQLVHADRQQSKAEFVVWDFNPNGSSDDIRLDLHFDGREIVVTNDNYFHAMQLIRLELEKENLRLHCYGASKNVYPSGMAISMGAGYKAYKLKLGEHGKLSNLVSIFDNGDDVILCTVAEQEQFFKDWLNFRQ